MNKIGFILLVAILFISIPLFLIGSKPFRHARKNVKPFIPPTKSIQCSSDTDCPSSNYVCEATVAIGSSFPGRAKPSKPIIIKGECRLKEGGTCSSPSSCASGLVCHANICTKPVSQTCTGLQDESCPAGYQCIQACGPPVVQRDDLTPPHYYCEIDEIAQKPPKERNCPICLASNTQISTPTGMINVKNISVGIRVFSVNKKGEKIISAILKISHTKAPKTHRVVHLVLADKREAWISPNHLTTQDLPIGELRAGDMYDGSKVTLAQLVPYKETYTYDILPDSDTGFYWANGILLKSTLVKE